MHRLEKTIRTQNAAHKTALIPFCTAGYPDPATFWPTLLELDENGADIIEIGVPFSDPVADGPVIEEASRIALQNGVNLRDLLAQLTQNRSLFHADIVLMGYYNPFLQYGLEALGKDLERAGVAGVIVPDLPIDEATPLRSALAPHDIVQIPLVGPNTSKERMERYAKDAAGYVYVVSVMGVTGARKQLPPDIINTLLLAKATFSIPVALGFGLTEPSQLAMLPEAARPDAAIFGSALVQTIAQGRGAKSFMAKWR